MNKSIIEITPFIIELHNNAQEININTIQNTLHITCEPWSNIRTVQHATLYIDEKPVTSTHLVAQEGRLALPPVFEISTRDYFKPGQHHKIHIGVIEPDGSQNPNNNRSRTLTIKITN